MRKAIGSKVVLDSQSNTAIDFMECVKDLFEFEEVKNLDLYHQHIGTSRLQHCLNVSYYSYRIAKALKGDYRSAARAGMLHDLFWYDWRTTRTPQLHAFYHPKAAVENALKIVELNKKECHAILIHMWPLCLGFPGDKVSFAVTVADKYCTVVEVCSQWSLKFLRLFSFGGTN